MTVVPLYKMLFCAIGLLPMSGQMATSDVLSDLADQCLAAVAAGDTSAFQEVAEAIKLRQDVFNTDARERAEACLSEGYGEPWEYWFGSSSFEPTAAIEARIEAHNDAKAAARQAEAKAVADEAENTEKIATLVYLSCSNLFAQDQIAAMTNQLCVDTFLANGLPPE